MLIYHKYFLAVIFCLAYNSLSGQWQQTNGPFSGATISGIVSHDSTIITVTNCGFYSKNKISDAWTFDTSISFSIFTQIGDSLFFKYDNNNLNLLSISNPQLPYSQVGGCPGNFLTHSDSCLFTGGNNFLKSSDYGVSWTTHHDGLPGDSIWHHGQFCCVLYFVTCIDAGTDYIFAGTNRGVYRNDHNLGVWTQVNNGLPPSSDISILKSLGDTLYAVSGKNIYTSKDFGNSWDSLFESPSQIISLFNLNSDSLYAGTDSSGIYFSGNAGLSWASINNGLPDAPISVITYCDSTLCCGTNNEGIIKYDGIQWQDNNPGIFCSSISSMILHDSCLVACDPKDVFISDDRMNWSNISPSVPHTHWSHLNTIGDTILLSGKNMISTFPWDDPFILYTVDRGTTWNYMNDPPFIDDDTYQLTVYNDRIYAAVEKNIFYTDDFGQSWVDISFSEPGCYAAELFVDSSVVMASSCYPQPLRKLDNNQQWILIGTGLPSTDIYSIAKIQTTFFAGLSTGEVYTSNDDGSNWSNASNGLTSTHAFRDDVEFASRLLISTDKGIFATNDLGQSWHLIDHSGLKNLNVGPMVVFNDTLYAGTYGNGVWKFALDSLHIGVDDFLQQKNLLVYPNPFSSYAVVALGSVLNNATISIYNSMGQEVRRMNNVSGDRIEIHKSQLKEGLFFLVVDVNGSVIASTKFIILD